MVQKGTHPLQRMRFLGPPVVAPVVTALQRVEPKGCRSHVVRMMVQKGTHPLQKMQFLGPAVVALVVTASQRVDPK